MGQHKFELMIRWMNAVKIHSTDYGVKVELHSTYNVDFVTERNKTSFCSGAGEEKGWA